jgi:hypothetical protein
VNTKPTVVLSNCSALGVFRFDWTSHLDGTDTPMSVQWGEGLGNPLGFRGGVSAEIRNPERFGFKRPVTLKNFKVFAQAFADDFEGDQ